MELLAGAFIRCLLVRTSEQTIKQQAQWPEGLVVMPHRNRFWERPIPGLYLDPKEGSGEVLGDLMLESERTGRCLQ